ncbi:SDR family NAD(P)-dependent oxidoreductase [Brevibacterium zhoupengii]|uniref:SDR family NAD(P)-dependent oxidoreductase n=1 Tax=Brevibacterium zhoupengii TaxID=2898795 RepID=UPI001E423670|nr:SDR family oxidoreductase [Brevibacterium zhoupengii]
MSTRVAAVTGGASGIGEAAAKRFAADGYNVAVIDVDGEGGQRVVGELRKLGVEATYYECNVADREEVEKVANAVETDLGPVEALVTSAGLTPNSEAILEMDMPAHERMWKVNYFGTIHTCQSFGRRMVPRKKGAIVTLGSIHSRLPMPLPAYNPGKAAIERITQLLAVELGRHEIRVNSVGPTHVMTPPLEAAIAAGERDMGKIMALHPLPNLPSTEDVAEAIAFLCSDQARTISGVLLPIDSGSLAGTSYLTYAGGVPWEK